MFTIGIGMGAWLCILAALQMPHTRIRPHVWKKAMGLKAEKEQARGRAIQLFPQADLRRKKDHGRAEALLLAWYGQRLAPTWTAPCRSVPTFTSSAP
jgi:crossover junction endodeoxyribonuclease RuvC